MGETEFQPREFPQSGSKARDGERKRERDRTVVITMATFASSTTTCGARKHAWTKTVSQDRHQTKDHPVCDGLANCPSNYIDT